MSQYFVVTFYGSHSVSLHVVIFTATILRLHTLSSFLWQPFCVALLCRHFNGSHSVSPCFCHFCYGSHFVSPCFVITFYGRPSLSLYLLVTDYGRNIGVTILFRHFCGSQLNWLLKKWLNTVIRWRRWCHIQLSLIHCRFVTVIADPHFIAAAMFFHCCLIFCRNCKLFSAANGLLYLLRMLFCHDYWSKDAIRFAILFTIGKTYVLQGVIILPLLSATLPNWRRASMNVSIPEANFVSKDLTWGW